MARLNLLSIGAIDVLVGCGAWYLFIGILNSIYTSTSSILFVSVLFALRTLTSTVSSIPLSILADRIGVKRVLILVFLFLIFLIFSLYSISNSTSKSILLPLLSLAIIVEALITTYNILKYAIPPKLKGISLERINAIYEMTFSFMMVAGPLIAAFLINLRYLGTIIITLCLVVSGVLVSQLRLSEISSMSNGDNGDNFRMFDDLRNGLKDILRKKTLKGALIIGVLIASAGSVVNLAIVPVADALENGFINAYSMIVAFIGLGSAISGLTVFKRELRNQYRILQLSIILISVYPLTLLSGFSNGVWVLLLIAVGSTLNGMGNGFTAIILTSAIQKKANRNVAKVLAFIGNTENIVGVMVTIVAGVVMENFHHIQLMLLISSPIFLLSLIFVGFMDLKS